jgi:hypothetical protein
MKRLASGYLCGRSNMSKIEKRICVSPCVERLFTYVPEAAGAAQLWPGLLEVGEVERLSNGGALARWLYKMTGVIFEDWEARTEPLVGRDHSAIMLGETRCAIKWNFRNNTPDAYLILDGDHTYWSMC